MEPDQQQKQIEKLAAEVLALSRNSLLVQMRFLDTALSRFELQQTWSGHIMTDGKVLKYNPKHILRSFRDERNRPVRDYLHLILHCVFHHPFVDPSINQPCWDLACDIAVEAAMAGLDIPDLACSRQQKQQNTLLKLSKDGVILTAEKIYRYYMDRELSAFDLESIRSAFFADDHDMWYPAPSDDENDRDDSQDEEDGNETPDPDSPEPEKSDDESGDDHGTQSPGKGQSQQGDMPDQDNGDEKGDDAFQNEPGETEENPDPDSGTQSQDPGALPESEPEQTRKKGRERQREDQPGDDARESSDVRMNASGEGSGSSQESSGSPGSKPADRDPLTRENTEEIWNDIARRIKVDLETASMQRGDGAGALMQSLKSVTREKYDYSDFLRQFAVLGEAIQLNDDEFDYIYYVYGLKKYDNMPLIEPLEYKEVKRIKEFVIAIDTSGSVQGDEVQRFIQKTYNILLEEESFFTKINLHIIQCDSAIQEVRKITTREEFDRYMEEMSLKGFGGTDFRPVFAYVDRMRQEKEFTNLKGLIYFTDGDGIYPEKKPDYDTAFVFVRNDYEIPQVPVWAIRLVLDKDNI